MLKISIAKTHKKPETIEEAKLFLEKLDVFESIRKYAQNVSQPESTIRGHIKVAKKLLGHSPSYSEDILDGFEVKRKSTLYDPEYNIKQEWVISEKSKEDEKAAILAAIEAVKKEIPPLKPVEEIPVCSESLMACYVLSDFHLGMFAHQEEGGADWDLGIAKENLDKWIDLSVSLAPPAHTGVLLQLGDFLHQDGIKPVTVGHGHVLDSCARFQKIVEAAVLGLRRAISRMLEKHEKVHVIMASANHDPSSSIWLRHMFSALYENEPRVTVDLTEHPYYCFEWGDTSIFAHHGDKRNITNVSQVFAGMYREVFGRTKYSYGHIGHYHQTAAKEDSLMIVQIHPTLAAKDAYASHSGYMSQRRAKTVIYSKKHGEVANIVITPEMLENG